MLILLAAIAASWFLLVGSYGILALWMFSQLLSQPIASDPDFLYSFFALIVASLLGVVSLMLPRPGWTGLGVRVCSALANGAVTIAALWMMVTLTKQGDPGIAMLAFVLPGLLLMLTAVLGVAPRRIRLAYACTSCGYDLRGSDGDVCPECGAPHSQPVDGLTPTGTEERRGA